MEMRTRQHPNCYLCGTQGQGLYFGLRDRLFDAPGIWNLNRCPNPACGLIWLDPMPMEEDIALAYRRYYTHQSTRNDIAALAYRIMRDVFARATGLISEQRAIRTRYLGNHTPGKLLEIGCGAGDNLALMQSLGWTAEGVEIDPLACGHARQIHGLTVHEGTVESKNYPENSFDAIVLNHVIEHVFDSVALLKECYRIVKPSGQVVVITPNNRSWGHSTFHADWFALDPPRHIYIYSLESMKKCATLAEFKKILITTTPANAEIFFGGSMNIRKYGHHDMLRNNSNFFHKVGQKMHSLFFQFYEHRLWKNTPDLGEEIVMICRK